MASQQKRGWVWDAEEKAWIQDWKPDLKRQHDHVSEQVRRFAEELPAFADEASRVADAFLQTSKALLSLDGQTHGRKYQPLSPEEAKVKLTDAERAIAAWTDFANRPDVRQAVADVNRRISARKREFKKERRQAEGRILKQLTTPEFAEMVRTQVSDLTSAAGTMAAMAQQVEHWGKPTHVPVFQRLLLLRFITEAHELNRERGDAMRAFLSASPTPSVQDALAHVATAIIRDNALRRLWARPSGCPGSRAFLRTAV